MYTSGAAKVKNFHVEYLDILQHWHESRKFAGGDHLLTAIQKGWEVESTVQAHTYWCGGMRSILTYEFVMHKDDQTRQMHVIVNPFVNRFIRKNEIEVQETAA